MHYLRPPILSRRHDDIVTPCRIREDIGLAYQLSRSFMLMMLLSATAAWHAFVLLDLPECALGSILVVVCIINRLCDLPRREQEDVEAAMRKAERYPQ